ncbi:hypothetical protein Tco_0492461 [Tanacetum coccineum]
MKIMINDESDISDYEEDDLNILEEESTSDNESEACECVGNCSLCKPLYDRLKKNPKPWTEDHTKVVRNIKNKIKELPCLNIPHPDADLIVETYASDIEAFPSKVLAGYIQYKKMFTQEDIPPFEYTLQFLAIFKLPWILSFTHKKQEAEGTSPPLLIRQFSAKWWKQINESQADKEAVIKYYNSLIQESPSTSTSKFTSASKLSKINVEIAKKIEECENDEDFARVISQIRSSPTPRENLFQDSQDPYDDIDL